MTVDTTLLLRGMVTAAQFNELIEDYDQNITVVASSLDALHQRVNVLETMLNGLIGDNNE